MQIACFWAGYFYPAIGSLHIWHKSENLLSDLPALKATVLDISLVHFTIGLAPSVCKAVRTARELSTIFV
jgi:hypothetical protein